MAHSERTKKANDGFPVQPPQIRKSQYFLGLLALDSVQSFKPHLLIGIHFLFVSKIGRVSRIWGVMKLRGPHRTPHE